jgi:hypothetical protein
LDSLREKSFSGVEPKFLYEEPKPGRSRTLMLLVILGILGIGVWARYHFIGYGGESAKPVATVDTAAHTASKAHIPPKEVAETPSTTPPQSKQPPTAATQPVAVPEKQTAAANKSAESQPESGSSTPPVAETVVTASKPSRATGGSEIRPVSAQTPAVAKPAAVDDSGDAAFRRGEAFLYGRGVAENCDQAVKYLKSASAKGSAKARSAFGTMYATGHCVPRDLPTSYSWFALALRADPNNQILSQDLNAIWNQMTPPERQLATKMKQ